jgi:formylglycine-generating enzyme required for sulfatase activity
LSPRTRPSLLTIRVASAIAGIAALSIAVQLAALERTPPVRCPAGLALLGGRCCGSGQTLVSDHCEGAPTSCAQGQVLLEAEGAAPACVFEDTPVAFAGGVLRSGAADWQLRTTAPIEVAPFSMDRGEVTVARFEQCVKARRCERLPYESEPGLPVVALPPERAEQFCRFSGGRLPSSAEWRFAASGAEGRRFPWGFTGLVCRRAAYGLVTGPCSTNGNGPDLVGARPDGRTPEGLVDLAGNVAEWTRDPDGRYRARGGSFRSRVAAELVTAAVEIPSRDARHVGFRCAYDATDTR